MVQQNVIVAIFDDAQGTRYVVDVFATDKVEKVKEFLIKHAGEYYPGSYAKERVKNDIEEGYYEFEKSSLVRVK